MNTKPKKIQVPKGVPPEEYLLAMALQNAKFYNLKPYKGSYFVNKHGAPANSPAEEVSNAVACCAEGAIMLADDSGDLSLMLHKKYPSMACGILRGNDRPYWGPGEHDCDDADSDYPGLDLGESIGNAFQVAMTDQDG